jgi:hypothetical protein
LLSDDVGTVVRHNDQLVYSFFNADQIIDFLLSIIALEIALPPHGVAALTAELTPA